MRPVAGPIGLLALLVLLSGGSREVAPSRAPQRVDPTGGAAPRCSDARAQLAHATLRKREMYREEEGSRSRLRERALHAYGLVERYFPDDRQVVGEAWFRAGEILRAAGEFERARSAFRRACRGGRGTAWRPRALLELGHLDRRVGDLPGALDRYAEAVSDPHVAPNIRDRVGIWRAKLLGQQGKQRDALRAWDVVAHTAQSAFDRLKAFDRMAEIWIDSGDLEAAAGALERCRRMLGAQAAEETTLGRRLQKRLKNMRALERLREAVETRWRERNEDGRPESDGGNSATKGSNEDAKSPRHRRRLR